jgi:hypothetical protein
LYALARYANMLKGGKRFVATQIRPEEVQSERKVG